MMPLTIVRDIGGSTRSENGECAGILEASGIRRAILDLEKETESIST